jgi:hypothetical protein
MVVRDSGEAGVGEWSGMVGEVRCSEAGEDPEGQVQSAYDELRGSTHGSGGNAEVGEEPDRAGSEGGRDSVDQGLEVGLGEAVEEEVGDDEVVFSFEMRGEVQGVGVVDSQAGFDVAVDCFAAAAEELEHGGAGVDGIGVEVTVLREELREKAAVSVAEDEGSLLLEEVGEVLEAAAFEGAAEGEVFEPAVRASYKVEVYFRDSG